jgi:hypothetical protein
MINGDAEPYQGEFEQQQPIKQTQYDYEDEVYTKPLTREETLEKQMQLIAYCYTKGWWREFEYGIKILLPLLPFKVRTQFKTLEYDTSKEGVQNHYDLFVKINEKIESDTNMIWKKRFIKTYK